MGLTCFFFLFGFGDFGLFVGLVFSLDKVGFLVEVSWTGILSFISFEFESADPVIDSIHCSINASFSSELQKNGSTFLTF